MNHPNASTLDMVSAQTRSEQSTGLSGYWLVLARFLWVILVALALAIFIGRLSIPIFVEIPLPNGQSFYGQIKGIQHYTAQVVHEFLSLQAFVNLISHMIETTTEQAKKQEIPVSAVVPEHL